MTERTRFAGIDALRGVSILAVVLLHISLRLRMAGHPIDGLPGWLTHLVFWNGNNGVTVFFAVSGFLITTMSVRRFGALARVRPTQFYRLRFARIAPMLLALVGVLCVLHACQLEAFHIRPERASLARAGVAALGFHLNWLEAQRGYLPASWDVLWSLSVEEAFYLGFPLACVLLRHRLGALVVGAALVALVIAGPFARTVWSDNELWREKSYLSGMDAIAMGCVTAMIVERGGAWRVRAARGCELAGAAIMLVIAVWPKWPALRWLGGSGLDASVLALGACLFMIGNVTRQATGRAWSAPLRALGRVSYEVYLTHEFVVIAATAAYTAMPRGPLSLWLLGVVVVAMVIGWLIARIFSEPANRWLRGELPSPP